LQQRFSACLIRPAFRHPPRVLAAARTVAAKLFETMRQVDVVAAEPALGQDRGDIGGALSRAVPRGIDHHARQPGRQRQPAQRAALIGDATLGVDGAELDQQRVGFGQRARRRLIEK